jgi:hypothetical protein
MIFFNRDLWNVNIFQMATVTISINFRPLLGKTIARKFRFTISFDYLWIFLLLSLSFVRFSFWGSLTSQSIGFAIDEAWSLTSQSKWDFSSSHIKIYDTNNNFNGRNYWQTQFFLPVWLKSVIEIFMGWEEFLVEHLAKFKVNFRNFSQQITFDMNSFIVEFTVWIFNLDLRFAVTIAVRMSWSLKLLEDFGFRRFLWVCVCALTFCFLEILHNQSKISLNSKQTYLRAQCQSTNPPLDWLTSFNFIH